MITICPNCGAELHVTAMKCPECGTGITGDFPLDELFRLTPEQLNFVKLFLKKRGNLSEVQKELGLSYPTVRNRLENILQTLGYDVQEEISQWDVLQQVKEGSLDAETALRILKEMKQNEHD
ncbi:DUF2089 domain-containing protein [Coprothermobacter platensis]|uniref:DUF2089 domain-containing protein n=1 Tax=Coprothermobacter platensis TaxID=108819 RepID=UPI00037FCE70|nr:DUF2089 domain-containing protein [Coprothermobacter platensis]